MEDGGCNSLSTLKHCERSLATRRHTVGPSNTLHDHLGNPTADQFYPSLGYDGLPYLPSVPTPLTRFNPLDQNCMEQPSNFGFHHAMPMIGGQLATAAAAVGAHLDNPSLAIGTYMDKPTILLPQTNLPLLLPLLHDQPPQNFTTKDQHLLKPPPEMGAAGGFGRRASDGGAKIQNFFQKSVDDIDWSCQQSSSETNSQQMSNAMTCSSQSCDAQGNAPESADESSKHQRDVAR